MPGEALPRLRHRPVKVLLLCRDRQDHEAPAKPAVQQPRLAHALFGAQLEKVRLALNDFICGEGNSGPTSVSFCTTLKTALRSLLDFTSSKSITASLSNSTTQAFCDLAIPGDSRPGIGNSREQGVPAGVRKRGVSWRRPLGAE
jgi:hypothetical protein